MLLIAFEIMMLGFRNTEYDFIELSYVYWSPTMSWFYLVNILAPHEPFIWKQAKCCESEYVVS